MPMRSWVESASLPGCDFPLENLPYGVFSRAEAKHIGVAIGNQVLDLHGCAQSGLLSQLSSNTIAACSQESLNALMALGHSAWSLLRQQLTNLLKGEAEPDIQERARPHLVLMRDVRMEVPALIGDYTDFYASIHHATRVGKLFRPDNPLLPNYKYVPIGYHGRASSIVASGTGIRRPSGQTKDANSSEPVFAPSRSLDYELEMGIFAGPGNPLGEPVPIASAEEHIFGLCLVNDWSARRCRFDIGNNGKFVVINDDQIASIARDVTIGRNDSRDRMAQKVDLVFREHAMIGNFQIRQRTGARHWSNLVCNFSARVNSDDSRRRHR